MVNWDFNAGTVLTVAAGLGGVLRFLHNYDKRVEVRHTENTVKMESIQDKLGEVSCDIKETRDEQGRCRERINDAAVRMARIEGQLNGYRPSGGSS